MKKRKTIKAKLPKRLLAGKTVVIAGNFPYPGQLAYKRFVIEQGGKVEASVTEATNLVLLGEGGKTIRNKLAKLHDSGFDIDVLDEPIELLQLSQEQLATAITDSASLKAMLAWPDWIWRELCFANLDYSQQQLGIPKDESSHWSVEEETFRKNNFDRAQFCNLSLKGRSLATCSFEKAKLDNVYLYDSGPAKLHAVAASNLRLLGCNKMQISDAKIQGVSLSHTDQLTLQNCVVSGLQFRSNLFTGFQKLRFSQTKLQVEKLEETLFANCHFEDCVFDKSSFRHIKFQNCKFDGSTFKNSTFQDIEFRKCDLRTAKFYNSELDNCDFSTSHAAGLILRKCRQQRLTVRAIQLPDIQGVDSAATRSPLKSKHLKGLIDVMHETDEITISFRTLDRRCEFQIHSDWFDESYNYTIGEQEHLHRAAKGSRNTKPRKSQDSLRAWNWLVAQVPEAAIDLKSVKVKSSKGVMSTSEMKDLVRSVLASIWQRTT